MEAKVQLRIDSGDSIAITNYIRMSCPDRIICITMNRMIDQHMLSSFIIAEAWCKSLQIRSRR